MPRYDSHIQRKAEEFRSGGATGSPPRTGPLTIAGHSFYPPWPREMWWTQHTLAYVRFQDPHKWPRFHSFKLKAVPDTSVLSESAQKLVNALEFVDTFTIFPPEQLVLAVKANGTFIAEEAAHGGTASLQFGLILIRAHWLGTMLSWKIEDPRSYPRHHLKHPALLAYYDDINALREGMESLMASLVSCPIALFSEREALKTQWRDRAAWCQHNILAPGYVLNFADCTLAPGSTIMRVNTPTAHTPSKPRTPAIRLGKSWLRMDGVASSPTWAAMLSHVENVCTSCKACHAQGGSSRMEIISVTCRGCGSPDWMLQDSPEEEPRLFLGAEKDTDNDSVHYTTVLFDGFCPHCREKRKDPYPLIEQVCPTCDASEPIRLSDVVSCVRPGGGQQNVRGFSVFPGLGARGVLTPEDWSDIRIHNLDPIGPNVWEASEEPFSPQDSTIFQALSPIDQAILLRGALVPPELLVAERRG